MSLIKLLLEFNKISREISNKKDDDDLARFLYEKLRKLVNFDCFTLGKFEGDTIVYNFYVEEGQIYKGLKKNIEKDKSLAYLAVSRKEIILINDFEKEIGKYVKNISTIGKKEIQYNSVMVCPLEIDDKIIGFFSVQDVKKNFFDAEKILLFKEVGNYLSIIYDKIENSNKNLGISKLVMNKDSKVSNPVGAFFRDLVKKVYDAESLIRDFEEKIRGIYKLKEVDFLIFKNFLNYNEYYYMDSDGVLVKKNVKEKSHINGLQKEIALEFGNNHIGNIYFYLEDIGKIDENFETLLEIFMVGLGSFLEKEELEFENREKHQLMLVLERSYKHLKVVNELAKDINSTMDIKELGRRVYNGITEILNSDCSVSLAYISNDRLEYEIAMDYGKEYDQSLVDIDCPTSFAAWVARNEKIVIINDYCKEAEYYIGKNTYDKEDLIGEVETNSLMYIPLYKNSEIIGVFSVQKEEKNFFDNYHIELVKSIASLVNIAFINMIEARQLSNQIEERRKIEKKLKKINSKLEKLSSLDSLTKLYNRRHFERVLKEFWKKAKDENSELGFLIFDLDYFKQLNDTHGHLEGDRALTEVSKIVKGFVSSTVKFGRFGGDEFVGIVLNPDKEELLKMGKTILDELIDKKIKVPVSLIGVLTLTMGVTIVRPNELKSMDELFSKADEALYIGKENGRAQIVFV